MRTYKVYIIILLLLFLPAAENSRADVVQIPPMQDNTLYDDEAGSISNGAGWYFFVGRTGTSAGGNRRRGVMAFDIESIIPAGATIQSVSLTVTLSKSPNLTARTISLRKLLESWGEGTSNAADPEGAGALSTLNDATWVHRFYSSTSWSTPGGSFSPTTSGSISAGGVGTYTFNSTAQMIADVQSWLDDPLTNFGWLFLGNESILSTARRFNTRENSNVASRPVLTVSYLPACCLGIKGDIDGNGTTADILDLTYMVNDLFRGGPNSPCPEEADLNNNGIPSTIEDLTYLINDIFRGGPDSPACP